jgi:hypothetical protein
MTEAQAAIEWFTTGWWTTAHRINPRFEPKETLCGHRMLSVQPAPEGMRHCGQCERRRS